MWTSPPQATHGEPHPKPSGLGLADPAGGTLSGPHAAASSRASKKRAASDGPILWLFRPERGLDLDQFMMVQALDMGL